MIKQKLNSKLTALLRGESQIDAENCKLAMNCAAYREGPHIRGAVWRERA